MDFSQFFTKARTSDCSKISSNSTSAKNKSSKNHKSLKDLLRQENDNLNSTHELNKALEDIDRKIAQKGFSDFLLLRKADILTKKRKFKQARQTINNISIKKNNSEVARLARELLSTSEKLKQQDSLDKIKTLVRNLHQIANKYDYAFTQLVHQDQIKFDIDIAKSVQEEAKRALKAELPVLSCELIDETLKAGQKSPLLILLKVNALNMMGQRTKSLGILEELKSGNHSDKITNSINKSFADIQGKTKKYYQLKSNTCLAKHLAAITNNNQEIEIDFLPKFEMISENSKVKSLIFNQALKSLENNPQKTLILANSILDFVPSDGASLQLKGQALAALNQSDKAIQTWKILVNSNNEKVSQKASKSISKILSLRAKYLSTQRSPEEGVRFYIDQHLNLKLTPALNSVICEVLNEFNPRSQNSMNSKLYIHELQLQLNTIILQRLEHKLRREGRLNLEAPAQNLAMIRKTAPKAG